MSNIVSFQSAGLPSIQTLASTLAVLSEDVSDSGVVILKMDKTGSWVFGADQTEVQDGSTWAVNPYSFVHGYIAWGEGEVLGEKMVPLHKPLPALDAAPDNAKKGWELQVGMSLKCLTGDDAGQEMRFTSTSVGGKKAVLALSQAMIAQIGKDAGKPVPVVKLESDHYQHKQFGKIFTPEFKVSSWMSMDAAPAAPAAVAPPPAEPEAPAAEPATTRRRRRPAVAA